LDVEPRPMSFWLQA